MISKFLFNSVAYFVNWLGDWAGIRTLTIPLWLESGTNAVLNVIARGVPLVSWIIPNYQVFSFLVMLTCDLFFAQLAIELITLILRIYDRVKI